MLTLDTPHRHRHSLSFVLPVRASEVWPLLIEPEHTQEYLFNCRVSSTWAVGDAITWQGHYQGYDAYQQGLVLKYQPPITPANNNGGDDATCVGELVYTTFDANAGLPDAPLNYIRVSYRISAAENGCLLSIVSDTFDEQTPELSQQRIEHVGQGWQLAGNALVELCQRITSLEQTTDTTPVRLGYVIQYVQSVPDALDFFNAAFGLTHSMLTDEQDYGEISMGATTLAFADAILVADNLPNGITPLHMCEPEAGINITLLAHDVPALLSQAQTAGAHILAEPKPKPWGQLVAYCRAPSGLLIEIATPMSS